MAKYKRKEVIFEAFQLTEQTRVDNRDWPEWLNAAWNKERGVLNSVFPTIAGTGDGTLSVTTPNNIVPFGYYIVRRPNGDLYPCCADDFTEYFEEV